MEADTIRDWSIIPLEILHHILQFLNCTDTDTRRMRSVCNSWRSSLPLPFPLHFPLPMILPKYQVNLEFPEIFNDFNVFGNVRQSKFYLISSSETSCNPSVWLARVEESVHPNKWKLQNPLSQIEDYKSLPEVKSVVNFLDCKISEVARSYSFFTNKGSSYMMYNKIVMLKCPKLNYPSQEFSLLALGSSGNLVGFKSGTEEWIYISCELGFNFCDVIAYNGRFYAIDLKGKLISIDPVSFETEEVIMKSDLVHMEEHNEKQECRALFSYLVESCGKLYMVNKFVLKDYIYNSTWDELEANVNNGEPLEFKVYSLSDSCSSDNGDINQFWVPVKSLGDQVFFVSNYVSFSVSRFEICWGQGNCIFFTQEGFSGPKNYFSADDVTCFESVLEFFSRFCGLYTLEDNTIITADHLGSQFANTFWPVPTWFATTELRKPHYYQDFDLFDFVV